MRRCPNCNRIYADDSLSFCLDDGMRLIDDNQLDNSEKTIAYPTSSSNEPPATEAFHRDTNAYSPPRTDFPGPYPQQFSKPVRSKSTAKIVIGLGVVILLLLVLVGAGALIYYKASGPSLNPYNGSLNDLFPNKVGEYTRESTSDLLDKDKNYGTNDGLNAQYTSPGQGQKLAALALRYASSADAKAGLRNLKAAWLKIANAPTIQNEEPRKIGLSTVGDRFVLSFATGKGVYWTNGAVLFTVAGEGNAALDFEKSFPY